DHLRARVVYPAPLAHAGLPASADRASDGQLYYIRGLFAGEIMRKITLHAFLPRQNTRPSPPLVQHDSVWQSCQTGSLSCPHETTEALYAPQHKKDESLMAALGFCLVNLRVWHSLSR